MSVSMVNQTTPVQTAQAEAQKAAAVAKPAANQAEKTTLGTDKNDVIKLETGFMPTLKGAGAGFLGGTAAAAVPTAALLIAAKSTGGWGGLIYGMLGVGAALGGAVSGTVAGAVTANSTTSKAKGALYGAGAGVITGAATGYLLTGTAYGAGAGAVLGAAAGAGGGFAGSMVAKTK